MKFLKKVLGFIALFLIIAGAVMLMWQYFRNKQLLEVLMSNSIVKGSIDVLKKMGIAVLMIIAGLIVSSVYFKVGGVVRRNEREKKELLKQQERELKAETENARAEAENARAEAEAIRRENEEFKLRFQQEETKENNEL